MTRPPKRIVVKVGSNILTDDRGRLDLNNMRHVVDQIAVLHKKNVEVLLVSSGAIVCGAARTGITPRSIPEKQAAAAVGQSILMGEYNRFFEAQGICIAQVLLTAGEIHNTTRHENIRNTLATLLRERIVPVINENDTVAVDEIKFGDNDQLSALVAITVRAQQLIILSDVDGLYDQNPAQHADAQLIARVERVTEKILNLAGSSGTKKGTGGMRTKVLAAKLATSSGIQVHVANGRCHNALLHALDGAEIGTIFSAQRRKRV